MGAFYYGNLDGVFNAVGDNSAEFLLHLSPDKSEYNLIFCKLSSTCICGKMCPQHNAVAPSRYFQAETFKDNDNRFLRARFYTEEEVLSNIRNKIAPELQLYDCERELTIENQATALFLRSILTQKMFKGGDVPCIILDDDSIPFEDSVRLLAAEIFLKLPASLTEGCCVCTGTITNNDVIRQTIQLLPCNSKKVGAIHASDCDKYLEEIPEDIKSILQYWDNNPQEVNSYGTSCKYLDDWKNLRTINTWEKNGITEKDVESVLLLLQEDEKKCWMPELKKIVFLPHTQEMIADYKLKQLINDKKSVQSVSEFLTLCDNQSTLKNEYCQSLYAQANEILIDNILQQRIDFQRFSQELKNYYDHRDHLRNLLPEQTVNQSYNKLMEQYCKDSVQYLKEHPSIRTLTELLNQLSECSNPEETVDVRNDLYQAIKQNYSEKALLLKLLQEIKQTDVHLKMAMLQNEYEQFYEDERQYYETLTLNYADSFGRIEELFFIWDSYLKPYEKIVGKTPEFSKQVFSKAIENDKEVNYERLKKYKSYILRFISKSDYQKYLELSEPEWKDKLRGDIIQTINSFFNSGQMTEEAVKKTGKTLTTIINSFPKGSDNRKDLKIICKSYLEQKLEEYEPQKDESPKLFDSWEQLCDTNSWKEKVDKLSDLKDSPEEQPFKHSNENNNKKHRDSNNGSLIEKLVKAFRSRVSPLFLLSIIGILLLYSIICTIRISRTIKQEEKLNETYHSWQSGNPEAEKQLQDLANDYIPARILSEILSTEHLDTTENNDNSIEIDSEYEQGDYSLPEIDSEQEQGAYSPPETDGEHE